MSSSLVLTISDSRSAGTTRDQSGPAAVAALSALGFTDSACAIVPDDVHEIRDAIRQGITRFRLIVTTGGTGIAPRDVTPEAVAPLIDKPLPGFGEIMRTATFEKTPLSIISRGGAGIARGTLIVMLPGSPRGVTQCLELLGPAIRHVCKILDGAAPNCEQASRPAGA